MNKNNIILIGFMGCGKTSFGKWISSNKDYEFCDTDLLIEKETGRIIKDIFAEQGEEYFRQLETDSIKKMISKPGKRVISVGGGLPVRQQNRELLKNLGTVVYLRTSVDELEKRLKNDTSRPLLKGGNVRDKILDLMSARCSIYEECADIIIDTDNKSFEKMYEKIEEKRMA